jgi:hypothetical protein
MPTWIFEPGHTEAEFRARQMMVTWVRGMFKDIHGAARARLGPRPGGDVSRRDRRGRDLDRRACPR